MKTKKTTYKTQAAFAAALQISGATMTRLIARDDFPVRKSPPWHLADVLAVQKWREAALREDRAALDHAPLDPATIPLRKMKLVQEIRKLKAQADGAELALQQERGKLLDAAEVETDQIRRIAAVKDAMRLAASRLSLKLSGVTDPTQVEAIVEHEMRYIANCFAQNTAPCADEAPEPMDVVPL